MKHFTARVSFALPGMVLKIQTFLQNSELQIPMSWVIMNGITVINA
jgi:hypothetical protein